VTDYLSKPRWALGVTWEHFPAEPLAAVARNMGAPLPDGITLAGTLDGAVSWSGQDLQGQIAFHDASLAFPNADAIQFDVATVLFEGDRIRVKPSPVQVGKSEATVGADYRWTTQELDLNIASESMTIEAVRSQAARLPAPLLEALHSGVWKGK